MSLSAAVSPLRAAVLGCTLWAVGVLLLTSIGLGFEASQNGWPPLVRPASLAIAAALAGSSYAFRFLRWHLLARRLAPSLGLQSSFVIGTIGFALALTPGRA